MMDKYISNFPEQLSDALKITQNLLLNYNNIQNIIITGMGGSGIGGTFAYEYTYNNIQIPVLINKSYHLPAFVNENTLVIVSSYSGNTEETLQCLNDAIQKKSKVVAITSGGKILDICKEKNFPVIILPKGFPPRTCLGYSFVAVLSILNKLNFISSDWKNEIEESISLLKKEQNDIRQQAKGIAQQIQKTFPIIYTLHSEALAFRLRQQLNENSKMLCSHHIIPEMNHNEIVGWKCLSAQHTVIAILTDFDLPQNIKRYTFCKKVFTELNVPVIEMIAKGNSLLAQWMYIVHLSDWISYELAILNNVDPVEVNVIDKLKNELQK
ncbi:MAG TPA: bifunctional phosphoglucose/phosphomannose isomerase [Bacteroidia bacterium]|nr:bifunctional phosphoglucose/phosphomannose isomerase [Bacteroidia bacterium]